jgi:hypothetical protein
MGSERRQARRSVNPGGPAFNNQPDWLYEGSPTAPPHDEAGDQKYDEHEKKNLSDRRGDPGKSKEP